MTNCNAWSIVRFRSIVSLFGADIGQALAGNETQRPDALARILDRHDPSVLDFAFVEHEVGHLLDRIVDVSDHGQAVDAALENIPENPANAGRQEPSQ